MPPPFCLLLAFGFRNIFGARIYGVFGLEINSCEQCWPHMVPNVIAYKCMFIDTLYTVTSKSSTFLGTKCLNLLVDMNTWIIKDLLGTLDTPSIPKWLSYLLEFFCPKMIVQFICPARYLRLKVKYFCTKLSSSSIFLTLQFRGRFGVVIVFNFKSHAYNYSVNGQWALISPKLGTWAIVLGRREYIQCGVVK